MPQHLAIQTANHLLQLQHFGAAVQTVSPSLVAVECSTAPLRCVSERITGARLGCAFIPKHSHNFTSASFLPAPGRTKSQVRSRGPQLEPCALCTAAWTLLHFFKAACALVKSNYVSKSLTVCACFVVFVFFFYIRRRQVWVNMKWFRTCELNCTYEYAHTRTQTNTHTHIASVWCMRGPPNVTPRAPSPALLPCNSTRRQLDRFTLLQPHTLYVLCLGAHIHLKQTQNGGKWLTLINDVQLCASPLENFFSWRYRTSRGEINAQKIQLLLLFLTKSGYCGCRWHVFFKKQLLSGVSWEAQQCADVNHPRSHLDVALSSQRAGKTEQSSWRGRPEVPWN